MSEFLPSFVGEGVVYLEELVRCDPGSRVGDCIECDPRVPLGWLGVWGQQHRAGP